MGSWVTELSLIRGWFHLTLVVGALAALAALLLMRRTRRWWLRRVPLAVLGALLLLGAAWFALGALQPWPDPLPATVWAWIGAGLLAVTLLACGWGRQRWWIRVLAVGAVLVVVLGAADAIDTTFGSYPTIGSALQLGVYDQVSPDVLLAAPAAAPAAGGPLTTSWRPAAHVPQHGEVAEVVIPAPASGFSARSAWVYVPPAYLVRGHPPLPVLVLLGGQPGGPRDWIDGGTVAQRLDAFARAHDGLAPVVVMPDDTGGEIANPLCTDSALGKAGTYLATDVPAWIDSTLQVATDHTQWAVGGFSYGGTCALQLAVGHPDLFPTFLDESGQQGPTLGSQARTVDRAFGGDEAALSAIDPIQQLAQRSYPASAGFLVVGTGDARYLPQQRTVADATRDAGMAITAEELAGGHDWTVWGHGFDDALPWLAGRLGLIP